MTVLAAKKGFFSIHSITDVTSLLILSSIEDFLENMIMVEGVTCVVKRDLASSDAHSDNQRISNESGN